MKRTVFFACLLLTVVATACIPGKNNPEPIDPFTTVEDIPTLIVAMPIVDFQHGDLVYVDGVKHLYYDAKLGDDYESALQTLIASRPELSQLGDSLYVDKKQLNILTPDSSQVFMLTFYERDRSDKQYPLKMLACAHDAIDTKGVHYDLTWEEEIPNYDEEKPEGSLWMQGEYYLTFVRNCGTDFQSAYDNLKPEIEAKEAELAAWYSRIVSYDETKITEHFSTIYVTNYPNENVPEFTLVQIYMYSNNSHEYNHVAYFGVIDSHGNFYHLGSTSVE